MADFIPTREDERDEFFENFCRWLQVCGEDFGFEPPELNELTDRRRRTVAARAAYRKMREAAKSARTEKDDIMANEEQLVRSCFRRLEAHPGFTNEHRGDLGKRLIEDRSSSGEAMLSPPRLHPEGPDASGRIVMHWGPNPDKTTGNLKPHGAYGLLLQYATGKKAPKSEDDWRPVPPAGISTESPARHTPPVGKGVTSAFYRAAYVNSRIGLMSAFCEPTEVKIS